MFCPCGHHIKTDSKEDAIKAYDEHSSCEYHYIAEVFDMKED